MTSTSQPRDYPVGQVDRLQVDPRLLELQNEALTRIRLPYGGDAWLATRHADVRTVLADPRFSRAAAAGNDVPRVRAPREVPGGILGMDPPEHTRLRRLVSSAFTVRRIEDLRPRTQQITDELLDRMVAVGPPADLVEEFAMPLPITVICELLGVPVADRTRFRAWTDAALAITAFTPSEIERGSARLRDYIAGLVARRRVEPTDDLLGALVRARDEGDRLNEDELVSLGVGLLTAGHETTANQISNFVYTLFTNPRQLESLRADPGSVACAVEELARYVPLGGGGGFARIATEDVEVGGVVVHAGEAVFTEVGTANRDPSVFERSHELDLHRTPNPHIGFGHGAHYCLGAQLARMELQVALSSLLARFPDLALAVDAADVPWRCGRLVRGPLKLPMTWTKVASEVGV